MDYEVINTNNIFRLSDQKDKFSQSGAELKLSLSEFDYKNIEEINKKVRRIYDKHGYKYTEYSDEVILGKYEDTFHPFGFYHDIKSLKVLYKPMENFFCIHTGVLSRARGRNSTASLFCLIEQLVLTRRR